MTGLAELYPFVRFCQVCGFCPFQMEIHPETKEFQRFTFSYLHPVTFWFISMQIFPIILNLLSFKAISMADNTPHLIYFMDYIMKIFYCGSFLLIYSIPVRYRHIQKAAQFIQQLDESIEITTRKSINVNRHIWIGFTIILTLVFLNWSYFQWLNQFLNHFN